MRSVNGSNDNRRSSHVVPDHVPVPLELSSVSISGIRSGRLLVSRARHKRSKIPCHKAPEEEPPARAHHVWAQTPPALRKLRESLPVACGCARRGQRRGPLRRAKAAKGRRSLITSPCCVVHWSTPNNGSQHLVGKKLCKWK